MSNPIPRQEYIRSGTVESLNVTGELKYQGVPVAPGGGTDEKAKVSSNDTTPGYLDGKLVAGSGITLTQNSDGGDETLTITSADTNDAVKVSSNDTTPGDLEAKLVAGTNITLTTNNDGGNETLTIDASGGGVTGFTGSQNTASPNNTVNASRLLVDATSTNADFVAQPKGTGALLAQLPDGAATGGNKRGAQAVDMQMVRSSASQVASGSRAFIAGTNNTASGFASIALGQSNTSTGLRSIAIGESCNASSDSAVAIGGYCTASNSSSVAMGSTCVSSGVASLATGDRSIANRAYMRAHSASRFSSDGDCQEETHLQRRITTDNTQTELGHGSAPTITSRITIASDATYTFSGLVTARRTDADNESAGWEIKGVIDNNAGTTALVGSVTVTALGDDSSGTWLVAVEADNTNDALVIKVTGENSKTIRWGATVTLMKVAG